MLVSAVQWSESARCAYISPTLGLPSYPCNPIPPLQVITDHQAELPVLYISFPLASYFPHTNVYMSILILSDEMFSPLHFQSCVIRPFPSQRLVWLWPNRSCTRCPWNSLLLISLLIQHSPVQCRSHDLCESDMTVVSTCTSPHISSHPSP